MGRRRVGILGLVFVVGVWWSGEALGEVTTERSASILVFPKVLANGTRDTIIQISNTSNSLVRAHCFYVNGALLDPTQPQGPLNPPLWQEVDFDIVLTKQQPTHWTVSEGRRVNPLDEPCGPGNSDCDDAGFDPGLVPPVVPDFTGELKCVEVDASGAPVAGNHLKGEATLVTLGSGDVSKYNAIGILGTNNNGDGTLVLGGGQCAGGGALQGAVCTSDEQCGESAPCAIEYNACPQTWIVNHQADGSPSLALEDMLANGSGSGGGNGNSSEVFTELTVVPCTQNFETQVPTSVTLQFLTTNEFESQFSVSTTVTCWGSFFLHETGASALTFSGTGLPDPQGTMFLKTKIRPAAGTPFGVALVAEEFHLKGVGSPSGGLVNPFEIDADEMAAAAFNPHHEGLRPTPDLITIPAEQLVP
ncbi:MAG: hypothetical protein KatS3mg076_0655 [Candidatus Binatia bacterium]|nr:MAG: hypothetical protein KatS3mg076_0655 [Candidatus Binatia bacterium]